jgi:hypothetical protein
LFSRQKQEHQDYVDPYVHGVVMKPRTGVRKEIKIQGNKKPKVELTFSHVFLIVFSNLNLLFCEGGFHLSKEKMESQEY